VAAPRWFTLRYGRYSRPFLKLLALGPDGSGLAVGDADVAVQMGSWGFSGRAPTGSVTRASVLSETVSLTRGVHGWRGDWLVNGAGDGLAEILFDPPMRAHVVGLPVRVRRLRIAVDDPQGLVAALAERGSGA
jgi:hypothetical protein